MTLINYIGNDAAERKRWEEADNETLAQKLHDGVELKGACGRRRVYISVKCSGNMLLSTVITNAQQHL